MSSPLSRLDDALLDVLVVGGGLSGASVARRLSVAGYRVALVERHDFGHGASGTLPRLVLGDSSRREPGRHSSAERAKLERLARRAPALTRPLPLLTAVREPGALWRRLLERLLGRDRALDLPQARSIAADDAAVLAPGLKQPSDAARGLAYELTCDGARLALVMALSARRAGARLANRCELLALDKATGGIAEGTLRDGLDGSVVRARVRALVLAAGAQNPALVRALGGASAERSAVKRARALIVPLPGDAGAVVDDALGLAGPLLLPTAGGLALVLPAVADDRAPDAIEATDEDREALKALAHRCLAETGLGGFVTCGPALQDGAATPALLTLPASIPAFSVTSGTPLGLDATARRVCDSIAKRLGPAGETATARPGGLPGNEDLSFAGEVASLRARGLGRQAAERLVEQYGSLWREVLENSDSPATLGGEAAPLASEIAWAVEHEAARTLADLLRRWRLPELCPNSSGHVARAAHVAMTRFCGWNSARAEREWLRWERESARRWTPLVT